MTCIAPRVAMRDLIVALWLFKLTIINSSMNILRLDYHMFNYS